MNTLLVLFLLAILLSGVMATPGSIPWQYPWKKE